MNGRIIVCHENVSSPTVAPRRSFSGPLYSDGSMQDVTQRAQYESNDTEIAVVDGADWIRNQMTRQSLPLDDIGLDFYYLADYAHKTRRAVCGAEDPQDKTAPGQVWVFTPKTFWPAPGVSLYGGP